MSRTGEWDKTYGAGSSGNERRYLTLPIGVLDPWKQDGQTQPFKPYSPEALKRLAENIEQNGLMEPILVRPKPGGRFEIIAGHNRVAACKLAGIPTVAAVCEQMDDADAAQRLVDFNLLHRETILPSELSFAYKLRLEAMERRKGRPAKNQSQIETTFDPTKNQSQVETTFSKGRAADILAQELKTSPAQIYRLIALTRLIPYFLDRVDDKRISTGVGAQISRRDTDEQTMLAEVMDSCGVSRISAKAVKALDDQDPWTPEFIRQILQGNGKQPEKSTITIELGTPSIGLQAETIHALQGDRDFQAGLVKAIHRYARQYARGKGLI